jgi:hypothetical protein
LLKILIIPDLTLLLEVPTVSAMSIDPNLATRVDSSVEVAVASIQHLEEVPISSTALPMPVPTAAAT